MNKKESLNQGINDDDDDDDDDDSKVLMGHAHLIKNPHARAVGAGTSIIPLKLSTMPPSATLTN